jgi:hypothetical protein
MLPVPTKPARLFLDVVCVIALFTPSHFDGDQVPCLWAGFDSKLIIC